MKRLRVLFAVVATGFVGCNGSDLFSGFQSPIGTSPSGVVVTVGDSNGMPGFRPSLDTIALSDSVQWAVNSGATDTFDIVWDAAPKGVAIPPPSGNLVAGQTYVLSFGTEGYYDYHDAHHQGMAGVIYVLNNNF